MKVCLFRKGGAALGAQRPPRPIRKKDGPASGRQTMFMRIGNELRQHAPFTALGTLTGIAIMLVLVVGRAPSSLSYGMFWSLHPLHVLLSAVVTASMFRLHGGGGLWSTVAVGYVGSIGIATLSDCLIPFVGEWLLAMPNRELHLGFIEKWWLVNPLAVVGISIGWIRPTTRLPHAGHVLLSTWASLFHVTLAMGAELSVLDAVLIGLFLFLAVWVPCCTSDIVFPLIFARQQRRERRRESAANGESDMDDQDSNDQGGGSCLPIARRNENTRQKSRSTHPRSLGRRLPAIHPESRERCFAEASGENLGPPCSSWNQVSR